ncbi:MAG: hypothetical protein AAGN15_15560 [Cyanobacteria bacterium J06581_3]
MLKSPFLFAVSVLIALVQWTGVAKAEELKFGLSFELPPVEAHTTVMEMRSPSPLPESVPTTPVHTEIAYRAEALPPLANVEPSVAVSSSESIGLSFAEDTLTLETLANDPTSQPETFQESTTGLLFDETTDLLSSQSAEYETNGVEGNWGTTIGLDELFENGTHSLVAHTVGSAEGTRQSDGRLTQAYYGHVDPGNGVWNLGTFSYQHEANSPEEADEKQLQRLKRQGVELEAQADKHGFTLSLEEKLNGLDLANQAPLAALDRGGYIDRLAQAKRLQMAPNEAILWARTHAYIDPDTRQWNAPGLGNDVNSISRDQDRRMVAISNALNAYNPAGIGESSLANAAGASLPANRLDSQANRLAALGSSEIAQHVLSEIEVSFGLPPVDVEASSIGVAVTEQPLPSERDRKVTVAAGDVKNPQPVANAATANESVPVVASADIGFGLLPTGPLAAITTAQAVGTSTEESNTEESNTEAIVTEHANTEKIGAEESNGRESNVEEEVSLTTTPAEPENSLDTEPEVNSKLQDLLSGIPERNVSTPSKTEETNESSLANASEIQSAAEPEAVERPSLWHTEDKIVQTKHK